MTAEPDLNRATGALTTGALAVINQTVWKIAASVGAALHRTGAVVHLFKAPVELAGLTGVPAPSLKTVHALIDLLTRP